MTAFTHKSKNKSINVLNREPGTLRRYRKNFGRLQSFLPMRGVVRKKIFLQNWYRMI